MANRSEDPTLPGKTARHGGDSGEICVGDRIRDYVVEGVISTGGFGTVYRVRHAVLNRSAALKALHPELISSGEAVTRFEREARAVNLIRHRNVVDIYDFGALPNGRPYFVMELLDGEDLETMLNERGALAPREVARILAPLCDALTAAHERNIIHRDIKPSNVFIDRTDGAERVVLVDFGIAKLLDPGFGEVTTTQAVVGSPSSMSPEQIRGADVDPRTDCYGLGVLTFQLLTGEPPFHGASHTVMQYQHVHAPRPRISTRSRLAPALDDVLGRAMAIAPADRFATVMDFLTAFERAAAAHDRLLQAEQPEQRSILAAHVQVHFAPGALDRPDERMLSDAARVMTLAARTLTRNGFVPATEAWDFSVFALPLGDEIVRSEERRVGIEACIAAHTEVVRRRSPDERIAVVVAIDAQTAAMAGSAVRSGSVLAPTTWVPSGVRAGIVATDAALRDVALTSHAEPGVEGIRRIAG